MVSPVREDAKQAVATAYDLSGEKYVAYADGDPNKLYVFDGTYAYGDRQTWVLIDDKLRALRDSGARMIRVLDLGCGPGTWLRRVVVRARELGFLSIAAHGTDIATGQVRRARTLSSNQAVLPGVNLRFDAADIRAPLKEADGSVDLCLCLYGVLNHVPPDELAAVLAEIRRVLRGHFIATVRSVGSTPTIYVDAIASARSFFQDHGHNRMQVELANGRHMTFSSHLFGSTELRGAAARHFHVEDLCGLDLFHGRFAGDPRWNPPQAAAHPGLAEELARLEASYCRKPDFIDHAAHLLLVAKP
jgi:SAM-dependent methyltransferase